jgi:hypothetical protein
LFFTLTNSAASSTRSFALPLDRLRGRFIFVGADIKAAAISPKPNSWNGIKVMVRI